MLFSFLWTPTTLFPFYWVPVELRPLRPHSRDKASPSCWCWDTHRALCCTNTSSALQPRRLRRRDAAAVRSTSDSLQGLLATDTDTRCLWPSADVPATTKRRLQTLRVNGKGFSILNYWPRRENRKRARQRPAGFKLFNGFVECISVAAFQSSPIRSSNSQQIYLK